MIQKALNYICLETDADVLADRYLKINLCGLYKTRTLYELFNNNLLQLLRTFAPYCIEDSWFLSFFFLRKSRFVNLFFTKTHFYEPLLDINEKKAWLKKYIHYFVLSFNWNEIFIYFRLFTVTNLYGHSTANRKVQIIKNQHRNL